MKKLPYLGWREQFRGRDIGFESVKMFTTLLSDQCLIGAHVCQLIA